MVFGCFYSQLWILKTDQAPPIIKESSNFEKWFFALLLFGILVNWYFCMVIDQVIDISSPGQRHYIMQIIGEIEDHPFRLKENWKLIKEIVYFGAFLPW